MLKLYSQSVSDSMDPVIDESKEPVLPDLAGLPSAGVFWSCPPIRMSRLDRLEHSLYHTYASNPA